MLYTIDSRRPGRAPAIMLRARSLPEFGVASPELPGPWHEGRCGCRRNCSWRTIGARTWGWRVALWLGGC